EDRRLGKPDAGLDGAGNEIRLVSVTRSPRRFSVPDDPRITRALCIVAHPDDIEFFCGGTVLRLTQRGVAVDFVLATSGAKGTAHSKLDGPRRAAMRHGEQRAAARLAGPGRGG